VQQLSVPLPPGPQLVIPGPPGAQLCSATMPRTSGSVASGIPRSFGAPRLVPLSMARTGVPGPPPLAELPPPPPDPPEASGLPESPDSSMMARPQHGRATANGKTNRMSFMGYRYVIALPVTPAIGPDQLHAIAPTPADREGRATGRDSVTGYDRVRPLSSWGRLARARLGFLESARSPGNVRHSAICPGARFSR
jgi:hypothetical protein